MSACRGRSEVIGIGSNDAVDPTRTSRAADSYDTDEPLLGPEGIAPLIVAEAAA